MAGNALNNVIPNAPLIVWLDPHIGEPGKNIDLKKAFSSAIDTRSQTWTTLTDRDYLNLLGADAANPVAFGDVSFSLIAFTDPDACYAALQRYRNRHIFFIVSGRLAEAFVPRILSEFQDVFTDPVTQDPYQSIYIFYDSIVEQCEWAIAYRGYVQTFTHEADLLMRIVHDAAAYFFNQAERQTTEHRNEALRFYSWSKKLYLHYARLGGRAVTELRRIEERMAMIEANQNNANLEDRDGNDDEVVN